MIHNTYKMASTTDIFYTIVIKPLHLTVTSSPARSFTFPQSSARLQTSEYSSKRACFLGSSTPGLAHL